MSFITAKTEIMNLIEEGYDNGYLKREEFEATDPNDKGSIKFLRFIKTIHLEVSHPHGQ